MWNWKQIGLHFEPRQVWFSRDVNLRWFYVASYGKTLSGPEHSARSTERVPYGFTQAKDGFKLAERMLCHHKPVILGSLPQYLRNPETSNCLNRYFLIIIQDSLSIMSRKILFQIYMTFTKCHKVVPQGVIGVTLFSLLRLPHKFYTFEVKRLPNFVILNIFWIFF